MQQVNLSMNWEPGVMTRLSWMEGSGKSGKKLHVAGWKVDETWSRHVYWGPQGLEEDPPESARVNAFYWSCQEFWLQLSRHRPYFGVLDVLPCLISTALTLTSFWIDDETAALSLLLANLFLNTLTGWDILHTMPPGNGSIPKIGTLSESIPSTQLDSDMLSVPAVFYGFNFSMCLIAFLLHIILQSLERTFPDAKV